LVILGFIHQREGDPMAADGDGEPDEVEAPPEHPVAQRGGDGRPGGLYLIGLFGGDTDGVWRLYLSPRLDSYAEFAKADVRRTWQIADGGLVPGFESTGVILERGARVTFAVSETLTVVDQLDLDVRMAASKQQPSGVRPIEWRTMTTKQCSS
jgi:hypothetical protein